MGKLRVLRNVPVQARLPAAELVREDGRIPGISGAGSGRARLARGALRRSLARIKEVAV